MVEYILTVTNEPRELSSQLEALLNENEIKYRVIRLMEDRAIYGFTDAPEELLPKLTGYGRLETLPDNAYKTQALDDKII